jgi:hypothetical protein
MAIDDEKFSEYENRIRARKEKDLTDWGKKKRRRILSNITVAVVVFLFVVAIIYLAVIMPVQLCTLSGATTEQCVAATCSGTKIVIFPSNH